MLCYGTEGYGMELHDLQYVTVLPKYRHILLPTAPGEGSVPHCDGGGQGVPGHAGGRVVAG